MEERSSRHANKQPKVDQGKGQPGQGEAEEQVVVVDGERLKQRGRGWEAKATATPPGRTPTALTAPYGLCDCSTLRTRTLDTTLSCNGSSNPPLLPGPIVMSCSGSRCSTLGLESSSGPWRPKHAHALHAALDP